MIQLFTDGNRLASEEELCDLIGLEFGWPEYGRNLNAVWDIVTSSEQPWEITWVNASKSGGIFGDRYGLIVDLLAEACEVCPECRFNLTG